MKKWHWIALGAVLLAVIIAASVRGGGPAGEKVYVEPVKRRNLEAIVSASGAIEPKVKVNISAHVIGKIERLYFKEGDTVAKGAKLVELEKPNFVAQRDRTAAEFSNRKIEVNRARMALANAEVQFKRARRLLDQGIQAQELFEQANLNYENSKAALASAQQGAQQGLASLRQTEDDLSRTTIVSPIAGKIVQLNAQEGEVVVTGTMNNAGSVIAIIADLSEILIEAEVGETDVILIRQRQPAKIKVDAIPDKEYSGRVSEIGSSAAVREGSGIRYFRVKVALDNADERLRPGMTAQVEIITDAASRTISVPIQSVVELDPAALTRKGKSSVQKDDDESVKKKKYVFIVENEKAKPLEVKTGLITPTHVSITVGLKGSEKIVTGPFRTLKKLRTGDRVRVEVEGSKSGDTEEKERESS